MMTRSILVAALVAGAAAPAAAQKSDRPEVRAHLDRAKTHFDLQEYARAEAELKEAYRLDPRPEILYALAQAQRLAGNCARAITSYRSFLRTSPPRDQARLAEENIARCEAEAKPTPPATPPAAPPATIEVRRGVPWYRNWPAHGLVLGGLAASGAGVYLALDGQRRVDAVRDARYYDDFLAASEDGKDGKRLRTIGYVGLGIGAAAVGAGVLVYWLRSPTTERRPVVSIDPRGLIVVAWER